MATFCFLETLTGWWFVHISDFHPYLGKIPILTDIFEMGWNQPLVEGVFWMLKVIFING